MSGHGNSYVFPDGSRFLPISACAYRFSGVGAIFRNRGGGGIFELFQEVLLILGQFRPLKNTLVFPKEFPKVDSVHGRPDRVPGLPRLPLGHPYQMQGQPAQKDVGSDPILFAMMDGTKFERGLQRPEGALDLEELLVPEGHVFRGERVVGGGQQIFSVEAFLRPDLPHVDGDLPVLRLPKIPTVGLVGQKRAGRLLVPPHLRVAHRFEGRADFPEVLLPGGAILLRLFRVEDQDEPATALALAHDDLLDLHVLFDLPVAPGGGERRLIGFLPVPQLLSEDVSGRRPAEGSFGSLPRPSRGPSPTRTGTFSNPARSLLDHLHRGGVGGIAGEHPAAHRDPFLGDRQPDHDLRKVVPLVLALPVAEQRSFLLVLFVPLEVGRGGVEEQEIHFGDVQASGGPDQDLGEVGVDAPVAVLVGVGQGGSGDPSPDAHVVQLGANGPQAGLDVAQTFPEGQLREGHAEKLIEAGELLDLVLSPVPANSLPELVHRDMLEQLREDGLAVVHGPSLPDRNGHRILGS